MITTPSIKMHQIKNEQKNVEEFKIGRENKKSLAVLINNHFNLNTATMFFQTSLIFTMKVKYSALKCKKLIENFLLHIAFFFLHIAAFFGSNRGMSKSDDIFANILWIF